MRKQELIFKILQAQTEKSGFIFREELCQQNLSLMDSAFLPRAGL